MENTASTDRPVQKTDNSGVSTSTVLTNDSSVLSRKKRQHPKGFSFIWFDPDINQNREIQTAIQHLERNIPCALATNDFDECEQYLMKYNGDKSIFFIVSNKFGKQIVPDIHSLPWIIAIYVYCTDRKIHTKWTADYSKVRGVISDANKLIQKITMDMKKAKRLKNLSPLGLLGKLPFSHTKSSHKKYIGATRKEKQGDGLTECQFIVIDITKRLDPPAYAMLQSLDALTENSIFIFDDISTVDFDELSKKATFLFVSSEFAATMEDEPEHIEAVFVLEENISKVDYQQRFDNGDDLIFQLADEVYRCYQQEAEQYSILGDLKTAEIKRNVSNKIHEELEKAYNSVIKGDTITATSIDA